MEALTAFDTETTGTDPTQARIVSAAVVRVVDSGEIAWRKSWLIDPGVDIPAEATEVHGITTAEAQTFGVSPAEALPEIIAALDTPLVIYNAPYDLTVLDHELARHGLPALDIGDGVLDPLVIDRAVDRYRKGRRTLESACEHYGVTLDGAHDATADAVAAAQLMHAICSAYPQVGGASMETLFARQVAAHAAWAANFEAYLRDRGDESARIDRTWPYRAAPRGEREQRVLALLDAAHNLTRAECRCADGDEAPWCICTLLRALDDLSAVPA